MTDAMQLVRTCVTTGRRAKSEARASFKTTKLCVRVRLDLTDLLTGGLTDWKFIVKSLLRAQDLYVEERNYDDDWALTEYAEIYQYYAGEAADRARRES